MRSLFNFPQKAQYRALYRPARVHVTSGFNASKKKKNFSSAAFAKPVEQWAGMWSHRSRGHRGTSAITLQAPHQHMKDIYAFAAGGNAVALPAVGLGEPGRGSRVEGGVQGPLGFV